MRSLQFACVVGAEPNFMKMAPLLAALETYANVACTLVHTGQHYDENLSDVFFQDLGIRRPERLLGSGLGEPWCADARVIEALRGVLERETAAGRSYDRVIVVGDVNSTMAAAIASVKLGIPVAHVEAGLRSFDRSMPEEINRIVTDAIADLLFVSEPAGMTNLRREGHGDGQLHLAGNVMIDTLLRLLPMTKRRNILTEHNLAPGNYGVVTLHRPTSVDDRATLSGLIDVLAETSEELRCVFPIHPRTAKNLDAFGLTPRLASARGILRLPPLGYLDFLALSSQAKVIVTDSGGLQEESTALGIPCLTARANTERPITVEVGTSTLVGNDPDLLRLCLRSVLNGTYKQGRCPELWDGRAAQRIAEALARCQ